MDSLISTFHIDAKLLIAQIVNFLIVFAILWWLAFKPLMKIMADREQKISKSLEDAEELERRLKNIDQDYDKKIDEVRTQSIQILEEADVKAEEKVKEAITRARQETEKVVDEARARIEEQRKRVVDEARQDLTEIVVDAVKKVLGQKIDSKHDKILAEEVFKKLGKK